jgi:phage shock protein A
LRVQVDDEAKQSRDWEKRAVLAVQEGRDDLAKQALLRQSEHGERANVLRQTWQAQSNETEKLKSSLRQLNDKIEEAKRKRNLLIAKQKRSQAQKRIHETMSGLSDTSAFDAFNRMAERIEAEEMRTLAAAEVSESLSGDTLEKEFARLESGGEAEERLLALKREMGLLPPSEDEVRRITAGDGVTQETKESAADASADSKIQEAELLEEFDRLEQKDLR